MHLHGAGVARVYGETGLPHGERDDRPCGQARAAARQSSTGNRKGLDFSNILYAPPMPDTVGRYCQIEQYHGLDKALDNTILLELCKPALEEGKRVAATLPIRNINRVVGTIVGSELTRRYGAAGAARRHHRTALPGFGRTELRRIRAQGHDAGAGRRRQRLLRQGSLRRQDHRLSAQRIHLLRQRRISSSATWPSTARPTAKPMCAAWPASVSACAIAVYKPWWKASATMAVSI